MGAIVQSPDVRPVQNWTTKTVVKVSIILYTVVELDTSTQTLTTYLWFGLQWTNEFISWIPENYCGIKSIFASVDNIWTPEFYILEMTEADDTNPVILYYNIKNDGIIKKSLPLRIVSNCNLEIFMYPFDIQKCNLTFVTESTHIQIIERDDSEAVYSASKRYFASTGEWLLLNITVKRTDWSVIYTITLKRQPMVQTIAFIIPICFMVLLDLAGMFINFTEGERLTFKIVVVLGFSVLMVVLTQILPTTDSPPLLCIFCFISMTLMVASLIGCITTSYLLNLSETCSQAHPWIKFWINTCLKRVLFFKIHCCERDQISGIQDVEVIENGTTKPFHSQERENISPIALNNVTEKQLLKILLIEVQTIQQELNSQNTEENGESDWHVSALVLNRLFTILYLLATIITFITVFSIWRQ
ncbi:5-hydroxytryptamine receptor 3A-like [Mantella aurantiaca]